MANQYFTFQNKAKPFTLIDPLPYNQDLNHVARGFGLMPDPQRINTGTQYYARLTATNTAGVYNAEFPAFPTTGRAGVRLYLTFPDAPAVANVQISVTVNGVAQGTFPLTTATGAEYPVGTFAQRVIYETVFRDDTHMQLLGAGSTVLTAVTASVNSINTLAGEATTSATNAQASAVAAEASVNTILNVDFPAVYFQINRLALLQATATEAGQVTLPTVSPRFDPFPTDAYRQGLAVDVYNGALTKAPAEHTHVYTDITNYVASTAQAGLVQLNSTVTSAALNQAATASAVQQLKNTLDGKADLNHTHTFDAISNPGATDTQAGVVQLSTSTTSASTSRATTPTAMSVINTVLVGKADINHTHDFVDITSGVPTSSTSVTGLTQLANNTTSTSTTQALTPLQGNLLRQVLNDKASTSHTHPFSDIVSGVPTTDPYNVASFVKLVDNPVVSIWTPEEFNANVAVTPASLAALRDVIFANTFLIDDSVFMAVITSSLPLNPSVNRGGTILQFDQGYTLVGCSATGVQNAALPTGLYYCLNDCANLNSTTSRPGIWFRKPVA